MVTIAQVRVENYTEFQREGIARCRVPLADVAYWGAGAHPTVSVVDAGFTPGLGKCDVVPVGPAYASGNPMYLALTFKTELEAGVSDPRVPGQLYFDRVLDLTNDATAGPSWAPHSAVDLAGTTFQLHIPYPTGTQTLTFDLDPDGDDMIEEDQEPVPGQQFCRSYYIRKRYLPPGEEPSFWAELLVDIPHDMRQVKCNLRYGNSLIAPDGSPQWPGLLWDLPGDITLEIGGAEFAMPSKTAKLPSDPVVGGTTVVQLISVVDESRFSDAYEQTVGFVLLYPSGATGLEADTLEAERLYAIEANSQNHPDHGTYGTMGVVMKRPTNSHISSDEEGFTQASRLAKGDLDAYESPGLRWPWFRKQHGHVANSGATGDSNEWAVTRGLHLARSGLADLRALRLSAYQGGGRPFHFYYEDGSPIDHANHTGKSGQETDLYFWHDRAFFSNQAYEFTEPVFTPKAVAPSFADSLGKRGQITAAMGPLEKWSAGIGSRWYGNDNEHHEGLFEIAYAMMSGDRWSRREAHMHTQALLAQLWPVYDDREVSSHNITGLKESRATGRMMLVFCGLYWVTGDDRIRQRLVDIMDNIIDVDVPDPEVETPGSRRSWLGRSLSRDFVRIVRLDAVTQYPGGGAINCWQQAIQAYAFWAAWRVTGDQRYRDIVVEVAYALTNYCTRKNPDSGDVWQFAESVQWAPNGPGSEGVPLAPGQKLGTAPAWQEAPDGRPYAIWAQGAGVDSWVSAITVLAYEFAVEEQDFEWAQLCIELFEEAVGTEESARGVFGWGGPNSSFAFAWYTNSRYDWLAFIEDPWKERTAVPSSPPAAEPPGGWPIPITLGRCVTAEGSAQLVTARGTGGIHGEECLVNHAGQLLLFLHHFNDTNLVTKQLEQDLLTGWSQQGPGSVQQIRPVSSEGAPYAQLHTDTPSVCFNPRTRKWLMYTGTRPGTLMVSPTGKKPWHGIANSGWATTIMVATRDEVPAPNSPWTQETDAVVVEADQFWDTPVEETAPQGQTPPYYRGGPGECSGVWVPKRHPVLGVEGFIRLFFVQKTGGVPGFFRLRSISYADAIDGTEHVSEWIKRPEPFWSRALEGNEAHRWAPFAGPYHPTVIPDYDLDGCWMMLRVGEQAADGPLALYWSPDWGDTWIPHVWHTEVPPRPLITSADPNGPISFYPPATPELLLNQRTPSIAIDNDFPAVPGEPGGRMIFCYGVMAHAASPAPQRPKETWITVAARPEIPGRFIRGSLPAPLQTILRM